MLQVIKLLNEMRIGTESAAKTYREHRNMPQTWFFEGSLNAINDLLHVAIKLSSSESLIEALYGKLFAYKHEGYGDWQRGRVQTVKYIIEWVENRAIQNG